MSDFSQYQQMKRFWRQRRLLSVQIAYGALMSGYAASLYLQFGFSGAVVAFDALLSLCLLMLGVLVLYRIHSYYHSRSTTGVVHLQLPFFFALLMSATVFFTGWHFFVAEADYQFFLNQFFIWRTALLFLLLLLAANRFWMDKDQQVAEQRTRDLLEHEKKLLRLELDNLRQQIQPHFLFNSLNSISSLTLSNPEQAQHMIVLLSDYLRLSIRKKESDFVQLGDELEYLQLYLDIEKIRFGDRLLLELKLDPNCSQQAIPAMVLQPLVENAIKYGVYGVTGQLLIQLRVEMQDHLLQLCISNPYEATSGNAQKGTGFGLHAVRQKLQLLYLRDDLLQINRTDTRFEVCLKFPIVQKDLYDE